MIKIRKISMLITIFLLVIIFSAQAMAVEAGGELAVLLSGVWQDDGSFTSQIRESLDLEFFLPQTGNNEIRYAFKVDKPLQDLLAGNEISYFTRKLYLKHRFKDFHLTLGRQPVSWSFGSLLNPVDYTPGAVALDEENNSKYIDAVEAYIPVNWNSSVSIVASFPEGLTIEPGEIKWGIRGRMGVKGYDLTLNYVQEAGRSGQAGENPLNNIISVIPGKRLGFTIKGDLGDLGVYGALGHYYDQGTASSNSYLLGADYSYLLNSYTKINLQLEYLGLEPGSLAPAQRAFLNLGSSDRSLDLLSGSLNYPLDDFSSISMTTMIALDDSSLILIPAYQNTLPGNIDLRLSGSYFAGKENSLYAPGNMMPQAAVSISTIYPF